MPRNLTDIAADFDALSADDFDYANAEAAGWERLGELCDELQEIDDPAASIPILFATMERLDDSDLGTPGPMVHTLESWPGYEEHLAQSVRRKPTPVSVWMVNRVLNDGPADHDSWVKLLQDVADHPAASDEAKSQAEQFLKYQSEG